MKRNRYAEAKRLQRAACRIRRSIGRSLQLAMSTRRGARPEVKAMLDASCDAMTSAHHAALAAENLYFAVCETLALLHPNDGDES